MSDTAVAPTPVVSPTIHAVFPRADVTACLRKELIETVQAEALVKGIALPSAPSALTSMPFQIDSLIAVSLLCTVEPIVGFELADDVVRAGGYSSIDSALDQLVPEIEQAWAKQNGVAP